MPGPAPILETCCIMTVVKIVSGGQTGVDRAALDAAISLGIEHGGWCPSGRIAEDGVIPLRYRLSELASAEYVDRTRENVADSDATLIFTRMAELKGGTGLTADHALQTGRPLLVIDEQEDPDAAAERIRRFVQEYHIAILNVAGPRESEAPSLGARVREILTKALGTVSRK